MPPRRFSPAQHTHKAASRWHGVIDAGISYVNNSKTATGHDNLFKYDDGVAQGSRWGCAARKIWATALKAIFVLENGFNSGSSTLGQGGAMFGRQAYVGLSQNNVGSLTFGRQYSFSTDYLGGNYSTGGQTVAGQLRVSHQRQWTSLRRAVSTTRSSSAAREFREPSRSARCYGFSNQAGAFAGAPATGAAAAPVASSSACLQRFGVKDCANGPVRYRCRLTANIRYPGQSTLSFSTTITNVATGNVREICARSAWAAVIRSAQPRCGRCTRTRASSRFRAALTTFAAYEAEGAKYAFTPALTAGAGYTYMHLSNANRGHWNQVDLSVDYALSKRTDVYALGIYQIAAGPQRHTGSASADPVRALSLLQHVGHGRGQPVGVPRGRSPQVLKRICTDAMGCCFAGVNVKKRPVFRRRFCTLLQQSTMKARLPASIKPAATYSGISCRIARRRKYRRSNAPMHISRTRQTCAVHLLCRVPKIRAHQRFRAMKIRRLDVHDDHRARQFPANLEAREQIGID